MWMARLLEVIQGIDRRYAHELWNAAEHPMLALSLFSVSLEDSLLDGPEIACKAYLPKSGACCTFPLSLSHLF